MLFFPGYLEKLKVSGIKWVSGFPGNITNKLPTIVGVLILNDCETGMWSKKVFVCVCVCMCVRAYMTCVRPAHLLGLWTGSEV